MNFFHHRRVAALDSLGGTQVRLQVRKSRAAVPRVPPYVRLFCTPPSDGSGSHASGDPEERPLYPLPRRQRPRPMTADIGAGEPGIDVDVVLDDMSADGGDNEENTLRHKFPESSSGGSFLVEGSRGRTREVFKRIVPTLRWNGSTSWAAVLGYGGAVEFYALERSGCIRSVFQGCMEGQHCQKMTRRSCQWNESCTNL